MAKIKLNTRKIILKDGTELGRLVFDIPWIKAEKFKEKLIAEKKQLNIEGENMVDKYMIDSPWLLRGIIDVYSKENIRLRKVNKNLRTKIKELHNGN